ncbi:MAG TPA: VCBS repeat-containing protein [Solirubrobacteraceae bacterium]|nr:VCBS repeat-containing protein [Solirubrobacteraceae bacterium]
MLGLALLVVIALLAFASGASAATPIDLGPERTYRTGDLPYSVETADLDGDGVLDIVSPNTISDDVTVLLGEGNGTFAPPRTFPGGDGPRTAVTGDFDEDGRVDVALSNVFARGVSVLRGDGRGNLGPPVRHAVGEQPRTVVTSDLDRDGHADLAVVNRRDDTVSILLGRGDGTFAMARSFPAGDRLSPGGDGDAYDLDSLDANRDGTPDLAVANRVSNNLSLLIGNGDGTFRPGPIYPAGRTPYDVTAGDFDGDRVPDLAVGNGDSRDISIFLGRGDGTFDRRPRQGAGVAAFALAVADLDVDGDQDLAVANNPNTTYVDGKDYAGSASLLLGRGDGGFGPPLDHGVGPRPVAIAADDLDGDGRPDLATANRGTDDISVLLRGDTRLSLARSARRVTWPGPVTLRGRLATADGRSLAGRRVIIEQRPWVRGAFTRVPGQPANGVRVAADGSFRLSNARPEWTTDYRARFPGDGAGHEPVTSGLTTTEQRVRVGLSVGEQNLRLGHRRALTGAVSHHSHAGLPVTLVIRRDGEVVDEQVLTLGPSPAPGVFGCGPARGVLCQVVASLAQRASAAGRASPHTEPGYRFSYRPSRPGQYTFVARFDGHPPGHLGHRSRAMGFQVVR